MKKVFIAICCTAILFSGCKEKGPPINFSNVVNTDTNYLVSPVPAPDPHNVLAEEFTGATCPNCPAAHDLLESLATAGRLNTIGLYVTGLSQTKPPLGAAYDFRNAVATQISDNIYLGGPKSGIPCGGIDRVPVSGSLLLYSSSWTDAYNSRLSLVDSVNLSVSSSYSAADTIATITATITYLQQVSTPQNLSIAIVEDSMVDFQEKPTGVDSNYLFTNVFRDLVTSAPYGDPILSTKTVKEPGRVERRIYTYKMNSAWKAKRCRIIAFVHYSNTFVNKDVFQSVQTKLAP